MKIGHVLDKYLMEQDYVITVKKESVYVVNYLNIEDFSSDKVVICYRGGKSVIKGSNLVVSKMLKDELLIIGKILVVEV